MIYFSNEEIQQMISLYNSGKTIKEISEIFKVSSPVISKRLNDNGINTKKKRCSDELVYDLDKQTKRCSKCNKELPLSSFNKGNSLFGRRSYCRDCEKEINNSPERKARKNELRQLHRSDPEYRKRGYEKKIKKLYK